MTQGNVNLRAAAPLATEIRKDDIVFGRDVIELLSSGMYVDPLSIYREYIQNAADSIERARAEGLLNEADGRISVDLDLAQRSVRIRDDGRGIAPEEFKTRLLSLGSSEKRGLGQRGFRGVGRLAALAYVREVVFRAKSRGEPAYEMRWDCRRLAALLRVADGPEDLASLLSQIVSVHPYSDDAIGDHGFEVELIGVARLRGDVLMNATVVKDYLSQVSPVRFSEKFAQGPGIEAFLREAGVKLGNVHLVVNGAEVRRPFTDQLSLAANRDLVPREIETFSIHGSDQRLAAVGWVMHHDYEGALPLGAAVRGLRSRSGNMQVGTSDTLEACFHEPRFNAWSVGEVHIIDERILPNGRRDEFEQNAHYAHLLNRLSPIARAISRRCRELSRRRKLVRDIKSYDIGVTDAIASARSASDVASFMAASETAERLLGKLARAASNALLEPKTLVSFSERLASLKVEIQQLVAPSEVARVAVSAADIAEVVRAHFSDSASADRLLAALEARLGQSLRDL